ncbi:hypothetical protein JCM13664_16210 [Methylothermus subterraneus]
MRKPILSRCWIVCWIVWLAAEAHAKPPPQEDECLAQTDLHIVHFSAFQPGSKKEGEFQRYCRELPRAALSYLGIDFMDRDARRVPIALAVVEEDAQGHELRTLLELAPQTYPQGVASLQANFDRPGRYAVLVRFQSEDLIDELRIPLAVGGAPKPGWPVALGGASAALGLGVSWYWWRRRL